MEKWSSQADTVGSYRILAPPCPHTKASLETIRYPDDSVTGSGAGHIGLELGGTVVTDWI